MAKKGKQRGFTPVPQQMHKGNVPRKKPEGRAGIFTRTNIILLLAAISFVIYADTLKNDYALDDFFAITKNQQVTKGISAIPAILSSSYHAGEFEDAKHHTTIDDLYRPLSLVTFAIEYQFFNASPSPSHFVNILFYIGCVVLLFVFLLRLFGNEKIELAFIATLLFAVHPIHVEAVANIKGRDELLCFFFGILALYLFAGYSRSANIKQLLGGAFCFFLSLLSKETSASLIIVIPLIFFFYANENKKRSWYITLSALAAIVLYLIIRIAVLNMLLANRVNDATMLENELAKAPSAITRIATAILIMGRYIQLLFVPYPLVCDYSYLSIPFVSFGNVWVLLSIVIYGALFVVAIYRLIKYSKDPLAFGILFFLLTIAMFSNILFLTGATMADRFLFFASAGFCLSIAFVIQKLVLRLTPTSPTAIQKSNKLLWRILVPVLIIFSIMTIYRNEEWADNHTLYSADIEKMPGNCRLYYYLGNDLVQRKTDDTDPETKQKNIEEGIKNYRKAITISPDFENAQTNIGVAFYLEGQYDSAEYHDKIALKLNPRNTTSLSALVGISFKKENYDDAIKYSRMAIEVNPRDPKIYFNLAHTYSRLKQYDSAINNLKTLVAIDASMTGRAYEEAASLYLKIGSRDSAQKYEGIAKEYEQSTGTRAN